MLGAFRFRRGAELPTPQERAAALARLGRGDVVALRDQLNASDYGAICDQAKERMDRLLRKTSWDQDDSKKVEKNARQFARDNAIQLQLVS
jgi:hypothetical protein